MKAKKQPTEVREQPLTYDDYATMTDEGVRYELVDGVLEGLSPGPSPRHQFVSQGIAFSLRQTCDSEYVILVSPIDVILSKTEVRQPDIIMIHRNRLSIITERGVEGAPDLVIEVMSPSSIKRDRGSKLKTYAAYSVPEYWIVDPRNKALEQYVLEDKDYRLNEVYVEDEPVRSERISCASFSMYDILSNIPELPNT